jgi:hypothetical protein
MMEMSDICYEWYGSDGHTWLRAWNVAIATKELNFNFILL